MRLPVTTRMPLLAAIFLGFMALKATATTYYVDINSSDPTPPYTNWSTASTDIQDAVNQTTSGDLVLVNPGVYDTGGETVNGSALTNRVAIINAITVQSVNGPLATVIEGYPVVGTNAIRCAYLVAGASLTGFTVVNGATLNSGNITNYYGGGIFCQASNSVISNCIINACSAGFGGGGYFGSYYNCIISNNFSPGLGGGLYLGSGSVMNNCLVFSNACNGGAGSSGGVYCQSSSCILDNCTIVQNRNNGSGVAGVYGGTLTNCIVYYNTVAEVSLEGTNIANTTAVYNCCTIPTNNLGANNIASPPGFVNIDAENFNLAPWSPCIDAGNNAAVMSSTDLAGNPRIVNNTVDIGAYEYQYQYTGAVHFVVATNAFPVSPYTNWMTAATNIQAAIDASAPGDFVVVSNGVFKTGGRAVYGSTINRMAVEVPVTVQGLSGENYTLVEGSYPSTPAVRCAYLTNGAVLIGLTLTNGYISTSDLGTNRAGAGIWCQSPSATLLNCMLSGNNSINYGGGAYSGTLIDCILSNNVSLNGGGCFESILTNCLVAYNRANFGGGGSSNVFVNCTLVQNESYAPFPGGGGGAYASALNNCTLSGNEATNGNVGGGAFNSTLNNCILTGNWAANNAGGGGVFSCTLTNCVLTGNWATNGGGADNGLLVNCILTNNSAADGGGCASNTLYNCFLAYNTATVSGGGAYSAALYNCTVFSNSASSSGGGACFGTSSDCVFTNNAALGFGGGACSNTLNNCILTANRAGGGGGAYGGVLNNCLIITNTAGIGGGTDLAADYFCDLFNNYGSAGGGGAAGGSLTSCILSNNLAVNQGGGVAGVAIASLTNCLIINNNVLVGEYEGGLGGGAYNCILNNCTVAFNHGPLPGIYDGTAQNCVIYDNSSGYNTNWYNVIFLQNCCTWPLPTGSDNVDNFTNDPLFVNLTNNFQLQPNSPCINSGNNAYILSSTDLDGNPRIVGGTVDIGAYEYQTPTSVISYAYLQQYGLPTDGSVDFADLDGTPFNVYQDWIAGLNPTNPASVLLMLSPAATNNTSGITVSWESVSGIDYNLLRTTNLPSAWTTIQSNLVGQAGTTSYTDTTATNGGPYFYQVGVQAP